MCGILINMWLKEARRTNVRCRGGVNMKRDAQSWLWLVQFQKCLQEKRAVSVLVHITRQSQFNF